METSGMFCCAFMERNLIWSRCCLEATVMKFYVVLSETSKMQCLDSIRGQFWVPTPLRSPFSSLSPLFLSARAPYPIDFCTWPHPSPPFLKPSFCHCSTHPHITSSPVLFLAPLTSLSSNSFHILHQNPFFLLLTLLPLRSDLSS